MTDLMTRNFVEATLAITATRDFAVVTGVSIDTRTLQPGDLFVALSGDQRDGHDFVEAAFSRGAVAALIHHDHAERLSSFGPLLPVGDTLHALVTLGRAARSRLSPSARVAAVTGSVGKTGTKEALRHILSRQGRTHASVASYNNHFGVPLTLARMPQDTMFGIFEIGMNHAGEIEPLTTQVKPHVALITTVEAVHIENFPNVEAIADEKSAIFLGLEEGGTAIINRDNPHYERMWMHASRSKAGRVLSFGESPLADFRLVEITSDAEGSDILSEIHGVPLTYRIGSPGKHLALNSLGALATCLALGADLEAAARAYVDIKPPQGRGSRKTLPLHNGHITIIDESYNANPASMRAALALLKQTPVKGSGRRIAVLGDMLELGQEARALHAALADDLEANDIDLVYLCGPLMKALHDRVPHTLQGGWFDNALELARHLPQELHKDDVLMVKGSNGSRMREVMSALESHFGKDAL